MLNAQCLSMNAVPGLARIFADYCAGAAAVQGWYGAAPRDRGWQRAEFGSSPPHGSAHRAELVRLLKEQNPGAGLSTELGQLAQGANVVVTGQQVGLLGGPLFTVNKAATAIAQARQATADGRPHVPVFWLASEDHDFAEINHVVFPARRALRQLTYAHAPAHAVPVGTLILDDSVTALVDEAWELLGYSEAMEALAAAYRPGKTLAAAFAEFYAKVFAGHGLLILDASGREAHRLGAPVLQAALERADELHAALLERNREIVAAGYHAQVAVGDRGSLLFLLEPQTGARVALKRTPASAAEPDGAWHAARQSYSTADLLGILRSEPERISPSALLRPVFQDYVLPTAAYVGGPAEIAYFAQSAVLYQRILGRLTPVLPRLSATLVEPAIGELMDRHELSIETMLESTEADLALRLAARAMPVAGKQALAAAGNALDAELTALIGYMTALDEGLGRSAGVSASKMRYQMNRLRRMAASFELRKEASLGRHAEALTNALNPHGGLQERTIGAAWFLARYGLGGGAAMPGDGEVRGPADGLGSTLIDRMIVEAADNCPGHKVIRL